MFSVSAAAFFASLVLAEQLLRDPTHPYTWLPAPCFLSLRGLPRGGAGEKGLGRGASQNHTGSPTSPPGRGKHPPQRQGWWLDY